MPVASNVHLMLADRKGEAALIEIIDGRKMVKDQRQVILLTHKSSAC
ncbi:hypothetical protein ACEQPO_03095 [Bacillus sp. SL00103]